MTRALHRDSPRPCFLRTWTPEQETAVLACMARGMMPAAIARELGMTQYRVEHKVHQLRRSREEFRPAATSQRRCLGGCGKTFASTGPGNRICRACKPSVEARA